MLQAYPLYSTELTDEERELGFELVEVSSFTSPDYSNLTPAVAYRFSESDRIVKMIVPVIGGASYRHECLRPIGWVPAGAFVFPTAEQALNAVCCHN